MKYKIKYIPLDSVNPADYNPRKIAPEDMKKLVKSISAFGFVDPIIINDVTGKVVGGHQRVAAAEFLKLKEIPAIFVSLDPTMEKAFNLALNKISGEWDIPKLKDVLGEIETGDFDIEITGFDEIEIEQLMTSIHLDKEDLDDVEQKEKKERVCPNCGEILS